MQQHPPRTHAPPSHSASSSAGVDGPDPTRSGQAEAHTKRLLVRQLLSVLNHKRRTNLTHAQRWRRIDEWTGTFTVGLNALCLSALVLRYRDEDMVASVFTTIFSSLAFLMGALRQAIDPTSRWTKSRTLASQVSDLAREVTIAMGDPYLDADALTRILNDLDHRLALIEGSEPLMTLAPSNTAFGSFTAAAVPPVNQSPIRPFRIHVPPRNPVMSQSRSTHSASDLVPEAKTV